MESITLNTGFKMPNFGLGTWNSDKRDVGKAVIEALKLGYRLIDCAAVYGNEAEVGTALGECFKTGIVKREDLFITSKLWNNSHAPNDVEKACRKTLSDLNLDYLDLYLIHWPICYGMNQNPSATDTPLEETWSAMVKLVEKGLVKSIGVSNFTCKKLERILPIKVPAVNQVELHPLLQQKQLREFCSRNGIAITAYSTLGSQGSPFRGNFPNILTDFKVIEDIAKKHNKTNAQIVLRWAVQLGVAIIPKSCKVERIAENATIFDFKLDDDDMKKMESLDTHHRIGAPFFYAGRPESEFWDNE